MNTVTVVYDMDDVLNNLNEVVFGSLNISDKGKHIKYFNIHKNDNLTESEKEDITNSYKSAEVFKRLKPVDGINRILDIEQSKNANVTVKIHSACLNRDIVEVKKEFLQTYLPEFNLHKVRFDIIGECNGKGIVENADIVVEDSIENLNKYGNCTKILINKPYNQSENYNIDDSNIIRVNSLNEAVDKVEQIVGVLNCIDKIVKSNPNKEVEVVVHGK